MKNLPKILFPVIIILIITACHNINNVVKPSERVYKLADLDSLRVDSFEVIKEFEVPNQFALPSAIMFVNSETLAILDNRANRQIKIINLKTGNMSEVLAHGHGPNEMVSVCSMSVLDNQIYVGGINDNKICIIDSVESDAPVVKQICTADYAFLNILPMDKNRILTLPLVPECKRYFELDISDGSKKEYGSFPVNDQNANNAVFQADLALSPENGIIIAVNRSWGAMEILNVDDYSTQTIITCPDEIHPTLKKVTIPDGVQYVQKPMGIALANVSASDNGFYVGYVGSRMDMPETLGRKISKIIYFNYDGSGGKFYNLPTEVTSFCVDPHSNIFYGLECSADGKVSILSTELH